MTRPRSRAAPAPSTPAPLETLRRVLPALEAHLARIPGSSLPTRDTLILTLGLAALEAWVGVQGPASTRLAWHDLWPVPWSPPGQALMAAKALERLTQPDSGPLPDGMTTDTIAALRTRLITAAAPVEDTRARLSAAIDERWAHVQARAAERAAAVLALQGPAQLPEGLALDEHQAVAVAWLKERRWSGLLADDQGIGKTISAIGALAERLAQGDAPWPVLIVAPVSVCGAWAQAITTWLAPWAPQVHLLTDRPPADPIPERLVLVVPWSRVEKHQARLGAIPWRQVVQDECQAVINAEALRTQAMLRMRALHSDAGWILLSGTPTNNGRGREWWAHLRQLRATHRRTPEQFLRAFGDPKVLHLGARVVRKYDGLSREADLVNDHLREVMLRRTKAELKDQLPAKVRTVLPVPLDGAAIARLARTRDEAIAAYEAAVEAARAHWMEKLNNWDAVEERIAGIKGSQAITELGRMRLRTGLEKVEFATEWAMERAGQPVVLFCEHHEVQRALEAALKARKRTVWLGQSDMDADTRTALIRRFMDSTGDEVLVLTRAFSAGVTLTRARALGAVERYWLPLDELQMEDRVHRRGQTQEVEIAYFEVQHPFGTDLTMDRVVTWKERAIATTNGSAAVRAMRALTR